MNYSVYLTPRAQADLREIFWYIATELGARQNAEGQLKRIEKAIASLAQMPERFPIYDTPKWRERNLRRMSIDNYLVFYIPNHDKQAVTVLRVLYGGRNIDRQLELLN